MILVKKSKLLNLILEEEAANNMSPLLSIKRIQSIKIFPHLYDTASNMPLTWAPRSLEKQKYDRFSHIASMLEDMEATAIDIIQCANDLSPSVSSVVGCKRHIGDEAFKTFSSAGTSIKYQNESYITNVDIRPGFTSSDIVAVYSFDNSINKTYIRRIIDKNHKVNIHSRYKRKVLNAKEFYYDQVFIGTSGGPDISKNTLLNLEVEHRTAWLKHKKTLIQNLRKQVKTENIEDYYGERQCNKTQIILDISFKISELSSLMESYKKEVLSDNPLMSNLRKTMRKIEVGTRVLRKLNYDNRNLLTNRVVNIPGGRAAIEKIIAKENL